MDNNIAFFNDINSAPITIDANKPFQSDQGHLRADAIITRVGVLRYYDPLTNDWINVLRHPDEIFNPKSLETLSGIPITIDHPIESGFAVKVTPKNFKKYGHGTVGDAIDIKNPYVKIDGLNIQTDQAFEVIKKGNKQLSPGYHAIRVKEAGVWEGINYSHRQYGIMTEDSADQIIRYNHAAIMSPGNNGRSGEFVKLLIDSEDQLTELNEKEIIKVPVLYHADQYNFDGDKNKIFDMKPTTQKVKRPMKQVILKLGTTQSIFNVDADVVSIPSEDYQMMAAAISTINDMMTSYGASTPQEVPQNVASKQATMQTEIDSLKADLVASEAAKNALQKEVDNLNGRLEQTDAIETTIAQRVALVKEAETFIGDCATKSPKEIKLEVIKKWDSTQNFEGDSADIAIDAVYPIALKSLKASDKSVKDNAKVVTDSAEKELKKKPSVSSNLTTDQAEIHQNLRRARTYQPVATATKK